MKKGIEILFEYDVWKKNSINKIQKTPFHIFVLKTKLNKFQFETIQVTSVSNFCSANNFIAIELSFKVSQLRGENGQFHQNRASNP